jgi:hypothetical protein
MHTYVHGGFFCLDAVVMTCGACSSKGHSLCDPTFIVLISLTTLDCFNAAGGSLDLEAGPSSSSSSSTAAVEADAVQQYKRRRLEVLELAPTVFADTDEQYASLTAVKRRLEGFKAQYPREYSQVGFGV